MAVWRKGYLYQYTGEDWEELDPKEHSDKYMVALADLLEHAPDSAFNNLFCLHLLANSAFIKYLQALDITLSELTEGGTTKRGAIKSSNFVEGLSGFRIKHDGDCEFNSIAVRNSAVLDSEIFAGPLYLSKETPQPVTRTFNPGKTASELSQGLGSYRAVNGQYNGATIKGIKVATQTTNKTGTGVIIWAIVNTKVYAVYENGNEELLAEQTDESKIWLDVTLVDFTPIYNTQQSYNTTHQKKLQSGLWFVFMATGFTLKLENLPDSQPAETGTVYRMGNNLMIA